MTEPAFVHEFRQYLAIIHKRRALLVTSIIVSFIVAVLYNYTTRPLYQATTQILIEHDEPDVLPQKEVVRYSGTPDYLLTEYQLLAGRGLAEKVVGELNLQKRDEFQQGPLMSPWERIQKRFLGRAPVFVDSEGIPLTPAIAAFRSRLKVEPLTGSRLVNIRFSAYDPTLAAQAVNTLAQRYIEQSLELRYTTSSEASGWLSERLREQKEKVEKAEHVLQAYREHEGIVNVDERQSLVEQKLTSLNNAIINVRTERISRETLLNQIRNTPPSQIPGLPALASSPAIAAVRTQQTELLQEQARLSETLGDKHPDLVRVRSQLRTLDEKIQIAVDSTVRGLESDVQASRQQEASLQASLESAKREALELNRKSIEYGVLKREVDGNQEMFHSLMTRTKESGLEAELKHSNIRIVEKADVPRAPVWPNKTRNYELALLIGVSLGLGLGFLFEHLDSTFKTPDDVKQHLGIPFLGMVPDVTLKGRGPAASRPSPLILRSPRSAVAEAYRVLRTNLIFSSAERTGHILIVSSANPGEGKTTTVANLSASLAINGSRVLAIDADLRRPTIHQHFGLGKTPGLSDLIVGKCRPSEAIHKTQFAGLQVMPCGYIPPNPTELLGSASLKEILAALKTHYDWIMIDTPPVLAMADTAVLCPLVDGMALVVGAEQSTRPAVLRAIDQIRSVNGNMIGVILNKVDFERNSYYYGQYYGEYYRSYYAERHEEPKVAPRPIRRV